MSIKTRISLLVLVLVFISIWALAVGVAAVSQRNLEQQLADQLALTVRFVAEAMDREVALRLNTLKKIAASLPLRLLDDPPALQRHLEERYGAMAFLNMDLTVLNKEGTVIASQPPSAARAGASLKDRPYFRAAMSAGKPVIGSPLAGRFQHRAFVPIAAPLLDASGAAAGIVFDAVFPAAREVFSTLDEVKIGETGYFLVVSPADRTIIAATDPKRILTQLPANPQLEQRLQQGYTGPAIGRSVAGAEILVVSRVMPTTGWSVLASVPTQEIYAPITKLRRDIYLAAVVFSLLVAVILRFVLRREFLRLDRAGAAIERMSEGKAPLAALPVSRDDEIGRLKKHFNKLVAERNRLEEVLREGEAKYRTLFESANDGIFVLGAQGFIDFNARGAAMYGLPREQLIGRSPTDFCPERQPDGRLSSEVVAEKLQAALQGRAQAFEWRALRADGAPLDVEINLNRIEINGTAHFHAIVRDITERKKLERQLQALSKRISQAHEEERRGITTELHEELAQDIATLMLHLQMVETHSTGSKAQSHLRDARATAELALERVRKLAHTLRPPQLDYFGLFAALRTHCTQQARAAGWKMHIDIPEADERFDPDLEIACFRVMQQALENVALYANATEVWVHARRNEDRLHLGVRDDGVGFDVAQARSEPDHSNLGLLAMEERIRQIGGRLQIKSSPGRGTEICAVVPLSQSA